MKKIFEPEESLLTEMLNTTQGASIYRAVVIFSILTISISVVLPIVNHQVVDVGQEMLWEHVQSFPLTMMCFLAMFSLVLLLYLNFALWASNRPKRKLSFIWDMAFLPPALIILAALMVLPPAASLWFNLPEVWSMGLCLKQVEIFFKTYSFLRVKMAGAIEDSSAVPTLKSMVLYLAVPTFIYEETYPRSDKIKWSRVVALLAELMWCAVMGAYLATKMQVPMAGFRSLWLDTPMALNALASNIVYTTLQFLIWFWAYVHSFPNLMAELTRFQHKTFYKDWWNSASFGMFFLKWNTLYQDWLYYCVYLDVRKASKSPTLASAAVFIVAILFHEWFLTFTFKFFYPVITMVYIGYAGCMVLESIGLSERLGNSLYWLATFIGNGILFTAYMMEIFSRINCPYPDDTHFLVKFMVPRCWTCPLTE